MLALLLMLALAAQAAAAPLPPNTPRSTAVATAAAQVSRAAHQLRADASVAAALKSVGVGRNEEGEYPTSENGDEPSAAEQALASFGFGTALDLRLLAGGPEAAELMAELRKGGELSIADRSKIRLLVGDREHLARVSAVSSSSFSAGTAEAGGQRDEGEPVASGHRRLQDQGSGASSDTLSADNVAIVFSVLVGVCGYLLQAWTSDKASRQVGALQREHDQETRDQQVQQDRMQAQIRRTERWVDDFCTPVHRALVEYSMAWPASRVQVW